MGGFHFLSQPKRRQTSISNRLLMNFIDRPTTNTIITTINASTIRSRAVTCLLCSVVLRHLFIPYYLLTDGYLGHHGPQMPPIFRAHS